MNGVLTAEQLMEGCPPSIEKTMMWHGRAVKVKKTLTLSEYIDFIYSALDACLNKETNTYRLEILDFVFRVNVVTRYAKAELPEDLEDQYRVLYETDLYNVIMTYINADQVDSLYRTVRMYMRI